MNAKDFLANNLKKDHENMIGPVDVNWIEKVADAWMDDENNSAERFKTIQQYFPQASSVLDMAAGCGTFVFYGLLNGFNALGIEPEKWKLEFLKKKIAEKKYPKDWSKKISPSFGECLPFENEFFDVCSTYQTLEHVSDIRKCLEEMLRVTKKNGGIHIICPDYKSTYEGHYRIFWLPLFPRPLAKLYLKLRGKDPGYLDSINYTTQSKIKRFIKKIAQKSDYKVEIIDIKKDRYLNHKKVKNSIILPYLYPLFWIKIYCSKLGKSEMQINLIVRKH